MTQNCQGIMVWLPASSAKESRIDILTILGFPPRQCLFLMQYRHARRLSYRWSDGGAMSTLLDMMKHTPRYKSRKSPVFKHYKEGNIREWRIFYGWPSSLLAMWLSYTVLFISQYQHQYHQMQVSSSLQLQWVSRESQMISPLSQPKAEQFRVLHVSSVYAGCGFD